MEECELCGKPIEGSVYVVEIENVRLRVCSRCARNKKVVEKIDPNRPVARVVDTSAKRKLESDDDFELVDNYTDIIKRAMERENLSTKQLAEKIKEQESYMKRIEEGRTTPPLEIITKLERTLNIKLIMAKQVKPEKVDVSSTKNPTLGDYLIKK